MLAVEDLVEETVARVIILALVAGQTLLVEQADIEVVDNVRRLGGLRQARAHGRGQLIEPAHIGDHVQVRLLFLGNQQGCLGQV